MADSILQSYVDFLKLVYRAAIDNPLLFALQVFALICLTTRRWTAFQKSYRPDDSALGTQAIPRAPYWVPILANTILFSIKSQSWLLDQARKYRSNVFSLKIYGRDHVIVTSPELCQALAGSDAVSDEEFRILRSRRFFANRNASSTSVKLVNRALEECRADGGRLQKLTKLLETNTYNLISPSVSWVDQAQWERTADVKVVSDDPVLSVSANINVLVRDFTAHILFSVLLGSSFIEANSSFVADFFHFSSKYSTFMTGMPYWLGPGLGPPALARERCLLAIDGLVSAVLAEAEGGAGSGAGLLYDTDDMHKSLVDIVIAVRKDDKHGSVRSISCQVLEVVFTTSFYTINLVVWLIVYLFSEGEEYSTALAKIREEIKKLVKVEQPPPSGLPFQEPPKLRFKTAAVQATKISVTCPSLSAAIKEIGRLETEPEDFVIVCKDFVLERTMQKERKNTANEKYHLLCNDHVYLAYGATNKNQQDWDRPRRFVPGRFGVDGCKSEEAGIGLNNDLTPELILIVAALLSSYQFNAADGAGFLQTSSSIIAGMSTLKKDVQGQVTRCKIA